MNKNLLFVLFMFLFVFNEVQGGLSREMASSNVEENSQKILYIYRPLLNGDD